MHLHFAGVHRRRNVCYGGIFSVRYRAQMYSAPSARRNVSGMVSSYYLNPISWSSVECGFFHEPIKLAILTLLPTLYSHIFTVSFFVCKGRCVSQQPMDGDGGCIPACNGQEVSAQWGGVYLWVLGGGVCLWVWGMYTPLTHLRADNHLSRYPPWPWLGTHPTTMHSCFRLKFAKWTRETPNQATWWTQTSRSSYRSPALIQQQVRVWILKHSDSESGYASESDSGWSQKTFLDHPWPSSEGLLRRSSETIHKSKYLICWCRWSRKTFQDRPKSDFDA